MPMRDQVKEVDTDTMIAEEEKRIFHVLSDLEFDARILACMTSDINKAISIDHVLNIQDNSDGNTKCDSNNILQSFRNIVATGRLTYKGMRRLKTWNVADIQNIMQRLVAKSDGGQHPEVSLYMNISIAHALMCDMQAKIHRELPEDVIEKFGLIDGRLRNEYYRVLVLIENAFCEMFKIDKFSPFIEDKLGTAIDNIYFQLDKIKLSIPHTFV